MLTTLRIKNLALVDDLTLELEPGYNAITGETGAGKSILIGALDLVLGERADRQLIRSGCDSCAVEAVFDVRGLKAPLAEFLDANGIEGCGEGQLVLKRTVSGSGINRQFVNGSPTTLQTLASIGQWLVDMHGPHDHQSLLVPAKQLALLDAFAKAEPPRRQFAELVRRHGMLAAEKAALIVDERTYAQQLDLLRFQVREIEAARLQPDEEDELEQEHQRTGNAARLLELSQAALGLLAEDEQALLNQAGTLGRILAELTKIDRSSGGLLEMHEQAVEQWRELQSGLSHYADKIEVDPARLHELECRLDLIHSLKRKYGSTLAEVLEFGAEARRKLDALEQRDTELERLNQELAAVKKEMSRVGQELSARRRKFIPKLCKAVSQELDYLGFKQSRFEISLSTDRELKSSGGAMSASGFDAIEFQFSPNPGEPVRALRAIASSGEMARVMLALKTVLAVEDEIPVLVFDEVDANVGGETAHAVGDKMRQIGRQRQVLCITHLAPVAACASAHFVAVKQVKSGRTISEIVRLERNSRVEELARMLGGASAAARQHAAALLAEG